MLKKLKSLFLLILVVFGLTSCNPLQSNKYSFKDITNKEINDVSQVLINEGPMQSAQFLFEGDYKKILDVDYVLSNMSYNDVRKIKEEYRFWLYLTFDNTNEGINFYVLDHKLYYLTDEVLYESKDKVSYKDFMPNDFQILNVTVMHDYGMYISGKVTTLLNGNLIWFNPSEYGIHELVAGDELIIKYTGKYEVQETYPGRVNADKMDIQSIDVIEADIVEFSVLTIPGSNELGLVPIDSKYNNYLLLNEGYVLSQDETFKKYDQYPEKTILYASLPKTTGSIRVDGLYDYKPRETISSTEYTDIRNALNLSELSINDVVEVRYERGYIGVAPGSLINIAYSFDMEDKYMVLNLLEMPVYEDTTNNWQVPGGGYTLYSIFTNDQRYDIKITNGYISIHQKHYKFLGEYISFKYPRLETNGFISYQETVEVWWNDTFICEIPTNELEFKQTDFYVSTEGDIIGNWVVKTGFGDLHFLEPKIFEHSNTYELTGLSLFELVEKYSNWQISQNGQPVQVEE